MELKVDKREKLAREIAKIVGVTALALSLVATMTFANSASNSFSSEMSALEDLLDSDAYNTNSWDDSWVPAGFTAWSEDSNVAWRWASKNNCSDYACITAEFTSQYGCPSGLYVALNWLDRNDSVVGYTNETLPSLLPMQNAKLTFDDYEEVSSSGQISTIRCN